MVKDKSMEKVEGENKVINVRRVVEAIRVLVNLKKLSQECARLLHEILPIPTLIYGKGDRSCR